MQDKIERRSNKERTRNTRLALIKAARKLFVEKGYAETSTPEIVKLAEVTRGALYHHFSDKTGLFRAVLEAEAKEIAQKIDMDSASAKSGVDSLMMGTEAYFEAMSVDGRTRLLLIDAPAVLGPDEMKEIETLSGADELREGLEHSIPKARQKGLNLDAMASILSAAFDRAALEASKGKNAADYKNAISELLRGLLKP